MNMCMDAKIETIPGPQTGDPIRSVVPNRDDSMMFHVELRRTVERTGPLHYVTLAEVEKHTGFRSVYAIDAQTTKQITQAKSFRGLQPAVYSNCLFVDFDGDEGVTEFAERLTSEGIGYTCWSTGRRGAHFHVPCVPMFGVHVPHSQLLWVEARATGPWDRTIYRPFSLIRLPGTWHEKNPGHRKEIMAWGEGTLANIPMVVPVPIEIRSPERGQNESDFWAATLVPKSEPGRTARVFYLGALARECGVDYDKARDAILHWAANQARPPLTDTQDVLRAFTSGYQG